MHIKTITALRKVAAKFTLPQSDKTITGMFADHDNQQTQQMGLMYGPLGALMTMGAYKKYKHDTRVPEFDPDTKAYIGRAHTLPETEEAMNELHKRIVGSKWKASAPRIFEWMMAPRKDRIKQAIIKSIVDGDANLKGLTRGEIASIVFPRILKEDGKIVNSLGFRRYPVRGTFTSRPITHEDIEAYLKKKKDSK